MEITFTKEGKKIILGVSITGKDNLVKFSQKIGFDHQIKNTKLLHLIDTINPKIGVTKNKIKDLLSKQNMTVFELTNKLKIHRRVINKHLKDLYRKGEITRFPVIRNGKYRYLYDLNDQQVPQLDISRGEEVRGRILELLDKHDRISKIVKEVGLGHKTVWYHMNKLRNMNKIGMNGNQGKVNATWFKL